MTFNRAYQEVGSFCFRADAAPGVEITGKKDGNSYVGYVKVRITAKPASGDEEVELVYDVSYSRRAQLTCPEKSSGRTSVSLTITQSATLQYAECRKENPYASAELSAVTTEKFTVVKRAYVEFFLTVSSNNVSVTWFDARVRLIIEETIAGELRIDSGRMQFISAQAYTPAATRRAGSYSAVVHGLATSDAEADALGSRAKGSLSSIQTALALALNASVTVTTQVKGTSDMPTALLIGLGAGGGVFLLALGWYMARVRVPRSDPSQQQARHSSAPTSQNVTISSSIEMTSQGPKAAATNPQNKAAEKSTAPAMQSIKVQVLPVVSRPGLLCARVLT